MLTKMRGILISDQQLFIDLIRPVLNLNGIEVVAHFAYVKPGLKFLESTLIDLILIDQIMPATDGPGEDRVHDLARDAISYQVTLDAVVHIRRSYPSIKVIAVTEDREPVRCAQLLRAGVHGLVCKVYGLGEFVQVLKEVLDGTFPALPEPMQQPLLMQLTQTMPVLTKQEHRVLRLTQKGLTNQQIARKTGLRPTTVRNYLTRTYKKLGANARLDAVIKAMEYGLLDYRA